MACPNMLSCAVLEWVKGFRRLGFQKRANGMYTASNTASVRPPNHGLDGKIYSSPGGFDKSLVEHIFGICLQGLNKN